MKSEPTERDLGDSSTCPKIRYSPSLSLSKAELNLLSRAFVGADEIFVERELLAGFSGARVLLIRPGAGRAPEVVKLGPPPELEREWIAYRNLVADYSPQNTARIQDKPLLSANKKQAVLRYSFAGGDPRQPACSLRTYFQEQGGAATVDVLNRVIRVYGHQWWSRNVLRTFTLSQEYDRLLPVHLKVQAAAIHNGKIFRDGEHPVTLMAGETNMAVIRTFAIGQPIKILDFTIIEVAPDKRNLTLGSSPPQGETSANLRIRIEDINPVDYRVGDQVMELNGVITATRRSLLIEGTQLERFRLDPEARDIHYGDVVCPNPLYDYTELLDHTTDSRYSIIHGDLNLENILVDRDTGFAWLIDFADTRRGPTLIDLQRIETQVISKLLPPLVNQFDLGAAALVDICNALHTDAPNPISPHPNLQEVYTVFVGIRRLARQFLTNDVDWDEYYRGLVLALLGTLKFTELETSARSLAFTGAAAARSLIGVPLRKPTYDNLKPATKPGWRWASVSVLVFAFLILIGGISTGWFWFRTGQSENKTLPIGLIAGFAGRVEVRHQTDNRVRPAQFGSALYYEDAVLTYEGAAANVLCQNGLLFNLGSGHTMVVRCQETDELQALGRLDPQLSTQFIQASREITLTLAPFDTRSSDIGSLLIPSLITPRNTAITETQPVWRWEDVAGSDGYQLTVINAVTGQSWQSQTSATELIYPVDAPPLLPGSTYLTQLKSIQTTTEVDESFFFLLDNADQQDVAATTAAIRALSLDPVTTAFLLVEYYQTQELYSAAIDQLEFVANKKGTSGLISKLGDLYFHVGLYSHARTNYQAALAEAELSNDRVAQATALVGLGRIVYVFGESENAIRYFQDAEILYRAAGEVARAKAVNQLLSEVDSQPNTITAPVSSPTP